MRFGELFAGISGFGLGLERAGHECAWQCELDPFCTRVLAERWPGVRRWADVRDLDTSPSSHGGARGDDIREGHRATAGFAGGQDGGLDLLVGGWPCQDLSVAGKRAGLVGARSGLFHEVVRIAQALRPTWGLFENVPGLLSSHGGRDMATVLEGLRQCWPVVGYRVLDSQHFGVAQRRRRVFFVCGPTETGVAEVLALTEGGGGDSAARGEAGERIANAVTGGTGRVGSRGADDGANIVTANGLTGRYGKGTDSDASDAFVFEHKASSHQSMNPSRLAPALGTSKEPAVFDTTQITSGVNRSNPKAGDPCHPLAEGAHPPLLVSGLTAHGRIRTEEAAGGMLTVTHALSAEGHDASEDGTGRGTPLTIAPTLNGYHGRSQLEGAYHPSGSAVRRLTPLECERLQNFPDGWTCLCQPLAAYAADPDAAALACTCPDSPRYRALGNAVTVSVIEWLGHRLMAQAHGS